MQEENYLVYLKKTIMDNPDKIKKFLVKKFIEKGIAIKSKDSSDQLIIDNIGINISGKDLTEQLLSCIQNSKDARLFYEKWEFIKDYKYSVLYSCDKFQHILEEILKIEPLKDNYENDFIFKSFDKPVAYHMEKFSFLKFNIEFAAIHPTSQEELLLKYPFLVVFHKMDKLIEFRFDAIKRIYISENKESTIYSKLISSMVKYLENNYDCKLQPIDLNFLINLSKNDSEVKLIAQYMNLPNGGNAQLEVGNNQEYVLPIIGEIRSILAENREDLEKVPSIKDALEQFIYEMDEMSDYPWIELLWEDEIKTRSIHAKFVFNYMGNNYCLIQHYYSSTLIGMERMNHVIKYIVDHKDGNTQRIE